VAHGADIHANNDRALRSATENGHNEVVDFLKAHGAVPLPLRIAKLGRAEIADALALCAGETGGVACGICFADKEVGDGGAASADEFIAFPGCERPHIFHKACVKSWARRTREDAHCPLCRRSIVAARSDTGGSRATDVPDASPAIADAPGATPAPEAGGAEAVGAGGAGAAAEAQ